jgi:short-subunit dehydrogenase
LRLNGSHVLITGGSKGLGALLAQNLIDAGARITLVARPTTVLEKTAADLGCAFLGADLSKPASCAGLVSRAEKLNGPVDVLVNNAGAGATRHYADLTAEELAGAMTLNLLSPMELSRQVLPGMIARKRGIIANVSSLAGEMAVPHVAAYGTSKAGLMMHTLTLRRDLARTGVKTIAFVIGAVPGTGVYDEGTTSPVTSAVGDRFQKLSKQLSPDVVASWMAATIERGRDAIVTMPRSAAPLVRLHLLPNRIGGLLFSGIDPGAPGPAKSTS